MSALKNVVIIEEDYESCELFKSALPDICDDASANCYHNIDEFLSDLTTHNIPSLIFMEINIPKVNGFKAAEIISRHELLSNVPFVIFTNSRDEADIQKVYNSGATHYAIKPTTYSGLLSQLNHLNTLYQDNMNQDGHDFLIPGDR